MISVEGLSLRWGEFRLENLSFTIPDGQYGVLMGKTGCGKTTLLEALCGLKSIDSGKIVLRNREVTHLKAAERGIGCRTALEPRGITPGLNGVSRLVFDVRSCCATLARG